MGKGGSIQTRPCGTGLDEAPPSVILTEETERKRLVYDIELADGVVGISEE